MDKRERLALWRRASTDERFRQIVFEKCRRDPVFFVNGFCWGYDPRLIPSEVPFVLYPFQEAFLRDWARCVNEGEDFGVEKSRDMGASFLILFLLMHGWRFQEGFKSLIGSRKADAVDKNGDMDSLMEKVRYNIVRWPRWFLPRGYNHRLHATYMKLINPENGNTITGESSNPNFARAGRNKIVVFDEMAFWPFADAAWASASQSTNCRAAISTPYGKGNKYGKLMNDPENKVITYQDLLRDAC